jgi:serine/threonine protein kinase
VLQRRTLREARAAAKLAHSNAVAVYDVVEEDGRPWIVMELVAAPSLTELIHDRGPLPAEQVAAIGAQLLGALRAAHRAGILHRDVKPGNVLVTHDGRAVLTDFGIATVEGDASITRSGLLLGSPAYLAPERVRGNQAGPASDVWSLGATLYCASEGHPPHDRDGVMPTLAAVISEPAPPPEHAGPLADVLMAMLAQDPAERPGTEELLPRLKGFARRTQVSPPAEPEPTRTRALERPPEEQMQVVRRPARHRRQWVVAALAVILAAALAGGLVAWLTNDGDPPGGGTGAEKPSAGSTTESPQSGSPSASPSASPSGTPSPDVPDGFTLYRDPTGYTLAIPTGWTIGHEGPGNVRTRISEPNGERFLLIDQTDQPKSDAVADWEAQEAARKDGMADYRRIRIDGVDYFREAADWEFTYTPSGSGPTHVLSRGFVTHPDQAYGLYWSTPADQWEASRATFDVFTETFRPRP